MLSPETRVSDFENSVKKYFVDNLQTTENIPLFFDWMDDIPVDSNGVKLLSWIIISFGYVQLGTVAECSVNVHIFTRNDFESQNLNILMDKVNSYIINEDAVNGLHTIPYYNTISLPWVVNGGIIPFIRNIYGVESLKDNTKMRTILLTMRWGSK